MGREGCIEMHLFADEDARKIVMIVSVVCTLLYGAAAVMLIATFLL
jgi:hypothetical protein